jgi:LL-diaminopimelate aminotransferase
MKFSKRLDKIPPYFFKELDRMKQQKIAQGVNVISLGIGDPDLPTAPFIVEAMNKAVEKPEHHRYPPYSGTERFRRSLVNYYKRRFDVNVDQDDETVVLIGSKEGIAHISMAVLDPGDILLVPDPGYPVYSISASFAGAESYKMPLLRENNFLPDYTRIPEDVARRAAMMFVNYPNNPTAAGADLDFYRETIRFAKKHDIIVVSDNAYSEIYYGEDKPPSILAVDGAKDIAVEMYSLSKPYNMTGWRVGACLGNKKIVEVLSTFKSNIDSGTFTAIQEAAAVALDEGDDFVAEMRNVYRRRRDKMISALKTIGVEIEPPSCSFYLWAPTPKGMNSFDFTKNLLDRAGVLVTPGTGFGENGEGYFRISLTIPDNQIDEAVSRMKTSYEVVGR